MAPQLGDANAGSVCRVERWAALGCPSCVRNRCGPNYRPGPESKRKTTMAGSVNKVILVGNLGRDPEIKQLPSGSSLANLSIATSETWRDKSSGERKEKTEWHRVVVFNEGLVRIVEQYLKK